MKNLSKSKLTSTSNKRHSFNDIVGFSDFKQYHKNNPTEHQVMSFEEVVARIETVTILKGGINAKFEDGTSVFVGFDGSYIRRNKLGQKQSSREVNSVTGINWKNHHIQIYIYGKKILLERFIAVCCDITNDALALYYDELAANVMDGSGSLETADYLNTCVNFEPSNLEWCTRSENSSHGAKIKDLYKITGHVYRFSAEDSQLDSLMKSRDFQAVKDYCGNNLFKVR